MSKDDGYLEVNTVAFMYLVHDVIDQHTHSLSNLPQSMRENV